MNPNEHSTIVRDYGQTYIDRKQALVEEIMTAFRVNLPSNYAAAINGPYYTLQFQALAERIAEFQIVASDVFHDADYDFVRAEFLWEMLGSLVFPLSSEQDGGMPVIDGDQVYRDFLKGMVLQLLQGATKSSLEGGVELLTDLSVTLVERFVGALQPGSLWTNLDAHAFDVLIEGLPTDAIELRSNVYRVLDALRPAHTIYTYAYLLHESLTVPEADMTWAMQTYNYDDVRKYCYGAKQVSGTAGFVPLAEPNTLTDTTRTFRNVRVGASVQIGDHAYTVVGVRALRTPNDPTARAYTVSPSGLSGSATVVAGAIYDPTQDFAACVDGDVLAFSTGPNALSGLRIGVLLGSGGGLVGSAPGPATAFRPDVCTLILDKAATPSLAVAYTVGVDKLGRSVPAIVEGEDASEQCWT